MPVLARGSQLSADRALVFLERAGEREGGGEREHERKRERVREGEREEGLTLNASNSVSLLEKGIAAAAAADFARLLVPPLLLPEPV